jgi:microcystin degradation protein MlrC
MIAGFLAVCREEGTAVEPLLYANAMASGMLPEDEFEAISAEIAGDLVRRGPFDVLLLAGHGASVSTGSVDPEGELARRVRSAVGPGTTIGLCLDLHGNVTPELIGAADVTVGYRENPHRDPVARGRECAELALSAAERRVLPVQSFRRLPMVVPILGGWTEAGAIKETMEEAEQIARRHRLLSHTVFHGFGYADVPQMGSSVLTVADGDQAAADAAALEIGAALWRRREGMAGEALDVATAFDRVAAESAGDGAIVLLDVGDNVGGGSPGDSTVLLAEADRRGVPRFAVLLCDPKAVAHAAEAGEGGEVEVEVGGTTQVSAGPRLRLHGRVERLHGGRFEENEVAHGGFRFYDGGRSVRLAIAGEGDVVLTTRPVVGFTVAPFEQMGIEPRSRTAIVAKGVTAPRAGFARAASDFLLVDTPGVTSADLSRFEYRRRPRPLWPLESEATA